MRPVITSMPEDDHRSLLAIDQFRLELREIKRLSVVEECRVVGLARNGDGDAKVLLIESCQSYIYGVAMRYAFNHPVKLDVMDLVQAGNEALVRHLDEALRARNTCAFLRMVSRYAVIRSCVEDKLIRVPYTSYRGGMRAPLTISLMAPLSLDNDCTLLDVLSADDFVPVSPNAELRTAALCEAKHRLNTVCEAISRGRKTLGVEVVE